MLDVIEPRSRRSRAPVVYDEDILEAQASQQSVLPSLSKNLSASEPKAVKHKKQAMVDAENVDPQTAPVQRATQKKQRTKRAADESQPTESPQPKKAASKVCRVAMQDELISEGEKDWFRTCKRH